MPVYSENYFIPPEFGNRCTTGTSANTGGRGLVHASVVGLCSAVSKNDANKFVCRIYSGSSDKDKAY